MTARGRSFVRELIAKPPLGHDPLSIGGVTLAEVPMARMTSVAPFNGQDKAIAKALKPMGLSFPAPGLTVTKGDNELLWTSRGQAFLIGPDPAPLAGLAALTDQSDGWAALTLTGENAPDILARLIPIDTRAMVPGTTARTMLTHMSLILTRQADGFRLMVFRSMARSAWHEIEDAMRKVAARHAVA
jgi:heterotetrameric sarcosine oxidase gamma subunit